MILTSLVTCLTLSACVQQQPLTDPALATVGSSYFCARIQFTITSPTTVTPNMPDRPCSGNPPVAIIDAGAMTWSEAGNRTLTIPFRIVNRGTEPVQLPVKLILPVSGKTVLDPPDTPNSTMISLNADSTAANGTKVWFVGSGVVAANDSTSADTLRFQINSPVIQGRFAFTITGETADTSRPPVPTVMNLPLDTTLAYGSDSTSWTYRAIWEIQFDDSTSGVTIRSVLDRYGLTVIGGTGPRVGGGAGSYIVRRDPEPSTLAAGDSILTLIHGEQGVDYVHRVIMRSHWRYWSRIPNDGPGLTRADWRTPGSGSYTAGWRLMRAPQAWGCETGRDGGAIPRIGVVDNLVDATHPDLSTSFTGSSIWTMEPTEVDTTTRFNASNPLHTSHGTAMAGIIAAKGNNDSASVGILWGADLRFFALAKPAGAPGQGHRYRDPLNPVVHLERIIDSARVLGVRVLNFSNYGIYTKDTVVLRRIKDALQRYVAAGNLVVQAAGDDGFRLLTRTGVIGDSTFGLNYRALADLSANFGDRILFVSKVDDAGGLDLSSNFVTGVTSIFAPGGRAVILVRRLDLGGGGFSPTPTGGTSLAAAFVTGVIGQLLAGDPALPAPTISQYLLNGSREMRWDPATSAFVNPPSVTLGGQPIPVLDAYGVLTVRSRNQAGAPLCGNRLFVDAQNRVRIQRAGPTNLQTIWQAVGSGDSVRVVYAYHGGRRVGIFTDAAANQILTFGSGTWTPGPWIAYPPTELAGTWYSTRETSHDGDSVFSAVDVPTGSGSRVDVRKGNSVIASVAITHLRPRGDTVPTFRTAGFDSTGHFTGWSYSAYVDTSTYEAPQPWGGWGRLRAIPSPVGDRVLILVNLTRFRFLGWSAPGEGWVAASGSTVVDGHNTMEVRSPASEAVSKTAQVYSMPWAGGTVGSPVKEVADRTIERMGISEDGSEVIVGLGRFGSGTGAAYPYADCEFQYWNAGGTYALKNTFPTAPHVCRETNNAGSFSAVIAGSDEPAPSLPNPFMRRPVPRSGVRIR